MAELDAELEELRQRVALLEVLHRVVTSIACLELDELLDALARELVAAIDRVSECTISLITSDGLALYDVVRYNQRSGTVTLDGSLFPLDEFVTTARLLEAAEGFVVCSVDDATLNEGTREYLDQAGWRCSIEVPLVVEGESVGLIELGDTNTGAPWTAEEIEFFQTLAAQAAVSVRNAQLYRRLRDQAQRDSLTGLLNHRSLYERLESALSSGGETVIALIVDLDDFKAVNDQLGHHAGDQLLRRAAEVIDAETTTRGFAGRIGGDEFGVVIPADAAPEMISRRLLHSLKAAGVPVSIGCSRSTAGDSADQLMRRADGALLTAKAGGKDQSLAA